MTVIYTRYQLRFWCRMLQFARIKVEDNCTIGINSVMLPYTTLESGASLDALTLILKGQQLKQNSHWQGSPASTFGLSLAKRLVDEGLMETLSDKKGGTCIFLDQAGPVGSNIPVSHTASSLGSPSAAFATSDMSHQDQMLASSDIETGLLNDSQASMPAASAMSNRDRVTEYLGSTKRKLLDFRARPRQSSIEMDPLLRKKDIAYGST